MHISHFSHKKRFISYCCLFFLAALTLLLPEAHPAEVTLAWDASSDPQVAGYKVYYGTVSRSYSTELTAGKLTTYTVTALQPDTTYYFAVTAYDASGSESAYSNEVSTAVRTSSTCSSTITPTSQSFGPAGGTGSITVTSASWCAWRASNGVTWVTITDWGAGTGTDTVSYRVLPNSSWSSRTAALTVAGRTFTINQSSGGLPDLIISSFLAPSFAKSGRTITVTDATRNTGATAAPISITRYYLSLDGTWDTGDTLLGSRTVPALGIGATHAGSVSIRIPLSAKGSFIIAKADGTKAVNEASETNNTMYRKIALY